MVEVPCIICRERGRHKSSCPWGFWLCAAILTACTPSNALPDPPVTVVVSGSEAGDCSVAIAVCAARLIRSPDGGAYCPPCP
jgi:hypothetical protein